MKADDFRFCFSGGVSSTSWISCDCDDPGCASSSSSELGVSCGDVDGFRTGDDGETDGDFGFRFSGGVSTTWPWISSSCDDPGCDNTGDTGCDDPRKPSLAYFILARRVSSPL